MGSEDLPDSFPRTVSEGCSLRYVTGYPPETETAEIEVVTVKFCFPHPLSPSTTVNVEVLK